MHGFVGVSSNVVASNLIVVAIASNYNIVASYSTKVQMQQLVVIQT
jgi:hypothetical protein